MKKAQRYVLYKAWNVLYMVNVQANGLENLIMLYMTEQNEDK